MSLVLLRHTHVHSTEVVTSDRGWKPFVQGRGNGPSRRAIHVARKVSQKCLELCCKVNVPHFVFFVIIGENFKPFIIGM